MCLLRKITWRILVKSDPRLPVVFTNRNVVVFSFQTYHDGYHGHEHLALYINDICGILMTHKQISLALSM